MSLLGGSSRLFSRLKTARSLLVRLQRLSIQSIVIFSVYASCCAHVTFRHMGLASPSDGWGPAT